MFLKIKSQYIASDSEKISGIKTDFLSLLITKLCIFPINHTFCQILAQYAVENKNDSTAAAESTIIDTSSSVVPTSTHSALQSAKKCKIIFYKKKSSKKCKKNSMGKFWG